MMECENDAHEGDTILGDRLIPCEECEAEAWGRHEEEVFEAARDARWED